MFVQNMTEPLTLRIPFITLLYPFQVSDEGVTLYFSLLYIH